MSINNLGNINPDNVNPNRRQNNNTSEARTSAEQNRDVQKTPAEVYRQFMVNNHNYDITFELANDNEESMRAIYEIDREAFADLDPYDSYEDFKRFITSSGISVYSLKDNTGEIIGYYDIEPIKDGDLYIDSMGLKPQYRNSRKGYAAIMQAWDKINDYAKENHAETMSLHVDATNPRLKKMYEQFGFEVKESYDNYYQGGIGAYYMVKDVVSDEPDEELMTPIQNESELSPAVSEQEQTTSAPPVSSPKELYKRDVQEATAELEELQLSERTGIKTNSFISGATHKDRNGNNVFNRELFDTEIKIAEICEKEESDYWRTSSFENIMHVLKEGDNFGDVKVRTDILPYINRFLSLGIEPKNIAGVLNSSREFYYKTDSHVSTTELDKAIYLVERLPQNKRKNSSEILSKCKLKDSNGKGIISTELIDVYNNYIRTHDDDYHISELFKASTVENEDGSEYFNRDTFNMLINHFSGNKQYGHPSGIYAEHILPQVYEQDITLDFYMRRAPRLKEDNVFKNILKKYSNEQDIASVRFEYANADVINSAAILKAISYRTYEEKTDYSTGKRVIVPTDKIDLDAERILRSYCQEGIPFDNILNFAKTMTACKEKTSIFLPEKFNPELLRNAIQLKKSGIDEKVIPEIMELCKIEESHYNNKKTKIFNDEIFQHVLRVSRENPQNLSPLKIKMSKDLQDGKERFRADVFETLTSNYVPEETGWHDGGLKDFQIEQRNGDKIFDIYLFQTWADANYPEVRIISDEKENGYLPRADAIIAYKTLHDRSQAENWEYTPKEGQSKDLVRDLMYACRDNSYSKWNRNIYQHVLDLKDKGYKAEEIIQLLSSCHEYANFSNPLNSENIFSEERYNFAISLMEEGIDIRNAGNIASSSITMGKRTNPNTDKMLEIYRLGSKNPVADISYCVDDYSKSKTVNEAAYHRMKDIMSNGLEPELIPNCRHNGEFSDRVYHLALDLQKRGYQPDIITKLMNKCLLSIKDKETGNTKFLFQQNIYDHIKDLEIIGVEKDNVLPVLSSCKYGSDFSEEAFSKISELHNKRYDDAGIAKFISSCSKDHKFSQEKYDKILELTKNHIDLRDSIHGDSYIIEKLMSNNSNIEILKEHFGENVSDYAVSMKIDGYINFVNQCYNLYKNYDNGFIKELESRLNELTSPEQKVKRLRVLGGLSTNVSQEAITPLLKLIKSPKMTEEQIQLANDIFTPEVNLDEYPNDMSKSEIELIDYKKRVEKFIEEINTPQQYKQNVRDFLLKERLDKSIVRPKPLDEQKAQMEKNAQQVLINPKIPLDKKIAYIEEYKAKLNDMEANAEKYLKPTIYAKPIEKLKKVVEAYVNIPNDDIRFNSAIKETMYQNMGIKTTPELLNAINYDAKYFDKMFAAQSGFKENFKPLIELKKMNIDTPLRVARLTMPEEGSEKYEQYQRLGLIEQIKANLDTKRQIEEYGLLYDKWDSFDDNLRGEVFSSDADPETEYKNLKYNVINIFQDDLWNKINSEETQKLTEYLDKQGFKIFNNNLFKNGEPVTNSEIENFIDTTIAYISKDEYWKGSNLTDTDEIAGVTGFNDHIKGFQKRAQEIKNARTVNNIHYRLTDDDDIGRNIFFGNHVGCCNSVESTYAGYSAPMHLLNNYNRGIELVDEWGNSYGNSLCFFADIDGKLTFVIDSFEANGKLGSNPLVAEKLFEFAKQVCKEMGRPDAQVMVGPNYNNMDKSLLELTSGHKIKVLGTTSEKTYCDSVGGRVKDEINTPVENKQMYELKNIG